MLATTYHCMHVPFRLSLTDSHNNLLNWYDDSYFTEEEFEYSKGQALVKGGLTQPITSLHLCSQSGWAGPAELLSWSLLFRREHFYSGGNTGCCGGRRLSASRLAIPWAKDALPSDSWAKRRHERSNWSRCGGRQKSAYIWALSHHYHHICLSLSTFLIVFSLHLIRF